MDKLPKCEVTLQCPLTYRSGTPDTVLQNIYPADIVSWLEKSAEQIMNLYKCGINVYIFKIYLNKYVSIFTVMQTASQIGGDQENNETISNHVINATPSVK